MKAALKQYAKTIGEVAHQGDAREESYYAALAALLQQSAAAAGSSNIHVTTLPKPTEAGNPDFRVWDGANRVVGYVEAKLPSQHNLDAIEAGEQMLRYRRTFPNLILTNFCEFRLYCDGLLVDRVVAAQPIVLQLGQTPPLENVDKLINLLAQFFAFSLPQSFTAEALALQLAKRTRFLRDVVADQLRAEQQTQPGDLLGFYEAFQRFLIGALTLEEFADLYAQTVTYGLFAARTRSTRSFNRRLAFDAIPHTIGILRDVFKFISLGDLPQPIEWIVDDIAEVLAVADVNDILDRYFHEGKGSDPIVHFYETFLEAYDPGERERRGVFYTPEAAVSYIVRSLHQLLKTVFHRADGLAAENVTLLDPAAGTMTFLAFACQLAVQEFEQKYGAGGRDAFIRQHILKHFYAFELMMAPYAVGHLKIAFYLEELGHRLTSKERFQFYLTNTLEMEALEQTHLPGIASLAEESQLAGKVKAQQPILVILGNPPYSGHSTNKGAWIRGLIEDYKHLDGKPLNEKNPKWLQDDYVKFLRFAQWKIEQAGEGVVGMITNHSYLDNPTFRAMRYSLMQTFDDIYVLDLHGNALRRERTPAGGKDENVFDIQQGVAIVFLVKRGGARQTPAAVHHAELWGERTAKYAWLTGHDVATTAWQTVQPRPEFYLFVPRDDVGLARYNQFVKVNDLFPVNSVGIVTARDQFVTDFDKDALKQRIRLVRDGATPDEVLRQGFGLHDKAGWKLAEARKKVQQDAAWESRLVRCLYRPFDVRWIFYHPAWIERDRAAVMRHMMQENLGLVVPKRVEISGGWNHALVANLPIEHVTVSLKTIDYLFPLYLYPDPAQNDLFSQLAPQEKQPNLAANVVAALTAAYGQPPAPEAIFHYVYAVLYADAYREQYADFLRGDFPRIPFTADSELFQELAAVGARLAALHLLHAPELDPPLARFEGEGDSRVARNESQGFRYDAAAARVFINPTQHFAPVPPDLWEYQIGGYQVLEKWLKDRRDRRLTLEEIKTYCRVVTAIRRTLEVQAAIDALYPAVEQSIVRV